MIPVVCPSCKGSGKVRARLRLPSGYRWVNVICNTCQGLGRTTAEPLTQVDFEGISMPPGWWLPEDGEMPRLRRFMNPLWGKTLPKGCRVVALGHCLRIVSIGAKQWRIDYWDHDSRSWMRHRQSRTKVWYTTNLTVAVRTATSLEHSKNITAKEDESKTFLAWVRMHRDKLNKLPHPSQHFPKKTLWDYVTWMANHRPEELLRVRRIVGQNLKEVA